MSEPQYSQLRRNEHNPATQRHAKEVAAEAQQEARRHGTDKGEKGGGEGGGVPPDQQSPYPS